MTEILEHVCGSCPDGCGRALWPMLVWASAFGSLLAMWARAAARATWRRVRER